MNKSLPFGSALYRKEGFFMDKKEKYLIKNTTRAEREEIIRRSLGGDVCSGCAGCEGVGCGNALEMYKDYIEGKKELSEINRNIAKTL